MLEYKLNKNEGRMLHSLLGKVLNHFELTLKQFGLYADTLCIYDMLDTNDFEKLEFDHFQMKIIEYYFANYEKAVELIKSYLLQT